MEKNNGGAGAAGGGRGGKGASSGSSPASAADRTKVHSSSSSSTSSATSSPSTSSTNKSSAVAAAVRNYIQQWKDVPEVMRKLLSLLNSYASHECRHAVLDIFHQLLYIHPRETAMFLANNLSHHHSNFHHAFGQLSTQQITQQLGPFYPRKGGSGGVGGSTSSTTASASSPSHQHPHHPASALSSFVGFGGRGGASGGGVAIRPPKAQFQVNSSLLSSWALGIVETKKQ